MDERNRVLSPANGPLRAKLMFIGEAPGRFGADATQIPFHGDKAGDNFERLLAQVGLSRYDCFVTNAVLCNPRSEEGNNTPPTRSEIANCASFLRRQIGLVNPAVVATLGAQSLTALDIIEGHGLRLAENVRTAVNWNGRILIPLYHPGQRAMIHRSFFNQLADYRFVADTFRKQLSSSTFKSSKRSARQVDELIRYCVRAIVHIGGEIGYFKLHKLFYLLEYTHYRQTGRRFSRAYIVRQKDGPYVTDLYIGALRRAMDDIVIVRNGPQLAIRLRSDKNDLFNADEKEIVRDDKLDKLIEVVWARYGSATNEQLKTTVYMTGPMRALLRAEKYERRSTFNQPIEFGNSETG